jgi:hypothetical protein
LFSDHFFHLHITMNSASTKQSPPHRAKIDHILCHLQMASTTKQVKQCCIHVSSCTVDWAHGIKVAGVFIHQACMAISWQDE